MTPWRCAGCGASVDPAAALPFACPRRGEGGDVDHVLAGPATLASVNEAHEDPWLRYRTGLTAWHLAQTAGLSEDAYADIVGALQAALVRVDGRRFERTPVRDGRAVARALGQHAALWLKDETGQPSGSHKGRHLFGVMLALRVAEVAGLDQAAGLRDRPLAIASCGNAALAAAVIARAAAWPLRVFIPPDARASVVSQLEALGATIEVCERQPDGPAGDPCYAAFQAAVGDGALPFGVQGPDCGLTVEGGRTLGWELAEQLAAVGVTPDHVMVQVGGGALASGLAAGLEDGVRLGLLPRAPAVHTVQTTGASPLARAWSRFGERHGAAASDTALAAAARQRSDYMWAWETEPSSIAHGILDDETYDWLAIVGAMARTGGSALVASEDELARARDAVRDAGAIPASATGTSGVAGLLAHGAIPAGDVVAAVVTGAAR